MFYKRNQKFDGKFFQLIKNKSIIEITSINKYDFYRLHDIYKKERFQRKKFLLILIIAICLYVIFSDIKFDNLVTIIFFISITIICILFAYLILMMSISDIKKDISSKQKVYVQGKIQNKNYTYIDRSNHYYFVINDERIYVTYDQYNDYFISDVVRVEVAENSGFILNVAKVN